MIHDGWDLVLEGMCQRPAMWRVTLKPPAGVHGGWSQPLCHYSGWEFRDEKVLADADYLDLLRNDFGKNTSY